MRPPARLASAGLLLILLGLLSWASGADRALDPVLRLHGGPIALRAVLALTALGRPVVLVPVALVAAGWLALRRRVADAAWLLAAALLGRVLVELVKLAVERPRPPLAGRLEAAASWSFPSAHSANTAITGLLLAASSGRRWAWWAALAFTAAVGWSRLALAVHWPGDVLAGWGLALAWMAAALRFRPERSRRG